MFDSCFVFLFLKITALENSPVIDVAGRFDVVFEFLLKLEDDVVDEEHNTALKK